MDLFLKYIAISVFVVVADSGLSAVTPTPLQTGIIYLDQDQPLEATKAFRNIPFDSADWKAKVLAWMRYSFVKKDYDEVWRLWQLLKKTNNASDEALLLMKTAAFLNRTCPLEFPQVMEPTKEPVDALLEAATYRFRSRFIPARVAEWNDTFLLWFSGTSTTSLSISGLFALSEIPSAQLIKNGGCNLEWFPLEKPAAALRAELNALLRFLKANSHLRDNVEIINTDKLLITARGLALAKFLNEEVAELREVVANVPLNELIKMSEPERRFLWFERLSIIPLNSKDQSVFALSVLLQAEDADAAHWLELVDLNSLPTETKLTLLEKLLKFDTLGENEYLLFQLAQSFWENDDTTQTLQSLRRLLVLRSTPLSEPFKQASLNLAAEVFAAIKSSNSSLGAFYASVPNSLWKEFNRKLAMDLAIQGHSQDLRKLEQKEKIKLLLHPSQWNALEAVAIRSPRRLRQVFKQNSQRGRLNKPLMVFIDELAARQLSITTINLDHLKSINEVIATQLKNALNELNGGDHESLQLLLFTFTTLNSNSWIAGNATVRRGIIKAGHISFKQEFSIENPFVLSKTDKVLERNLIFLPEGVEGQKWLLQR